LQEIYDILSNAGFNARIEKKMHPKDMNRDMNQQGRVRVQLLNEDGTPRNAEVATRDAVMLYVATLIPKLKSRLSASASTGAYTTASVAAQSTAKSGGGGKKAKQRK